jgi:hypothetical protein
MMEYSTRYTNMYYAAKGGNWDLAAYQLNSPMTKSGFDQAGSGVRLIINASTSTSDAATITTVIA